ncbi:unnamed protein product [Vicia faba]|uniref:Uncharacterized protein n=1 Tax=Vicia faba TaxID=3906 RepID=A0AAV0Z1H6_VICFA|nr:unnamed protein product [Vicia faba]
MIEFCYLKNAIVFYGEDLKSSTQSATFGKHVSLSPSVCVVVVQLSLCDSLYVFESGDVVELNCVSVTKCLLLTVLWAAVAQSFGLALGTGLCRLICSKAFDKFCTVICSIT